MKVTAAGDGYRITGTEGGESSMSLKAGGYMITFRYNDDISFIPEPWAQSYSLVPGNVNWGADGWAESATLISVASDTEYRFSINQYTKGKFGSMSQPYEINVIRLPLDKEPYGIPFEYSGSGYELIGPIALKKGNATFSLSCPDLKTDTFWSELNDGTDGEYIGHIVSSLTQGAGVNGTKILDIKKDGVYFVEVWSHVNARWTISVTYAA